jgi:hypothetical protein
VSNHQIDEDFHIHKIDIEDFHRLYCSKVRIFVQAQESSIGNKLN